MKAVGLITEYNPFHKGHQYHLEQASVLSGADVRIAVMSGNFVQRGEPALLDKYSRAAAAVNAGVNLVAELPAWYALSSAEGFADGAVRTLHALGTESICFGAEDTDLVLLQKIAALFLQEPLLYQKILRAELARGSSFPAAREEAVCACVPEEDARAVRKLLTGSNAILGMEYVKSIQKHAYEMQVHVLQRQGNAYREESMPIQEDQFASAAAVRKAILGIHTAHGYEDADRIHARISQLPLPEPMLAQLEAQWHRTVPVTLDDFSDLFRYQFEEILYQNQYDKRKSARQLTEYPDISLNLANRMIDCFDRQDSCTAFLWKVKSRQYTYARISRAVCHILLQQTESRRKFYQQEEVPYVRILGFDEVGQEYLNTVKNKMPVPLITRVSDYRDLLADDIHAANVFNQIVRTRFGYGLDEEYRHCVYRKG